MTGIPATALEGAAKQFIYAHRGGWSDEGPLKAGWQSSLAALHSAVNSGADGIEFDVQRTADDVLVVMHNPEPHPYHGETRISRTLEELRADEPVVTLDEFLGEAAWLRANVNPEFRLDLEFKQRGLASDTLAALRKHDIPLSHVLFSSFDHHNLLDVRKLAPDATIGLIASLEPGHDSGRSFLKVAQRIRADIVVLSQALATPQVVRETTDAGIGVSVYSRWRIPDGEFPTVFADDRIAGVIANQLPEAIANRAAAARTPKVAHTDGPYPWNALTDFVDHSALA